MKRETDTNCEESKLEEEEQRERHKDDTRASSNLNFFSLDFTCLLYFPQYNIYKVKSYGSHTGNPADVVCQCGMHIFNFDLHFYFSL